MEEARRYAHQTVMIALIIPAIALLGGVSLYCLT
jgi:hypothetical protein